MSDATYTEHSWTLDPDSVPALEADGCRRSVHSADFYCEPDDVLRGAPVARLSCEGREGDVHKGATLMGGDFYSLPDSSFEGPSFHATDCRDALEQGFKRMHRPPPLTKDPYFRLAVTTLQLVRDRPEDLAWDLLLFFTNEVKSSLRPQDVNSRRCSVKAQVFVDFGMCTVKARLYDSGQGAYAVEFQRRSGDCVVFSEVFRCAVSFFRPRGLVGLGPKGGPACAAQPASAPTAAGGAPPGGGAGGAACSGESGCTARGAAPRLSRLPGKAREAGKEDGEEDVEPDLYPILELASLSECPGLQAEASAALARLWSGNAGIGGPGATGGGGGGRRAAMAGRALADLLKGRLDAAYPAACLLTRLAACPEGAACLAEQGLLEAMEEQLRSESTSSLLRAELGQATVLVSGHTGRD